MPLHNRLALSVLTVLCPKVCLKCSLQSVPRCAKMFQDVPSRLREVALETPCQVLRHGGHGAIYRGSQVTSSVQDAVAMGIAHKP